MAVGAITVAGAADIRLSADELALLRGRIDGDDGLRQTAAALDEVGAGNDASLPSAELGRLCECLDLLVMSVSPRRLSGLTGLMELRGSVCFT